MNIERLQHIVRQRFDDNALSNYMLHYAQVLLTELHDNGIPRLITQKVGDWISGHRFWLVTEIRQLLTYHAHICYSTFIKNTVLKRMAELDEAGLSNHHEHTKLLMDRIYSEKLETARLYLDCIDVEDELYKVKLQPFDNAKQMQTLVRKFIPDAHLLSTRKRGRLLFSMLTTSLEIVRETGRFSLEEILYVLRNVIAFESLLASEYAMMDVKENEVASEDVLLRRLLTPYIFEYLNRVYNNRSKKYRQEGTEKSMLENVGIPIVLQKILHIADAMDNVNHVASCVTTNDTNPTKKGSNNMCPDEQVNVKTLIADNELRFDISLPGVSPETIKVSLKHPGKELKFPTLVIEYIAGSEYDKKYISISGCSCPPRKKELCIDIRDRHVKLPNPSEPIPIGIETQRPFVWSEVKHGILKIVLLRVADPAPYVVQVVAK